MALLFREFQFRSEWRKVRRHLRVRSHLTMIAAAPERIQAPRFLWKTGDDCCEIAGERKQQPLDWTSYESPRLFRFIRRAVRSYAADSRLAFTLPPPPLRSRRPGHRR
jgi:hypothetical protein